MSAKLPVPPCKGCGSTNLTATSQATVVAEYSEPTHVDDTGALHFADSYAGNWAENERWTIQCGDCGRRMRTDLRPVTR